MHVLKEFEEQRLFGRHEALQPWYDCLDAFRPASYGFDTKT